MVDIEKREKSKPILSLKYRKIGDKFLVMDPETIFWGICDKYEEILYIEKKYSIKLRESLKNRIHSATWPKQVDTFEIHLTERCNFNCSYCYNTPNKNNNDRLNKSQLIFIIEKILNLHSNNPQKPSVIFHGGEPFLEKHNMFELIRMYSNKISFVIQTNGSLLHYEDINFLFRHKVNIGLSVDGLKDFHDKYRILPNGRGTFDVVEPALKLVGQYPYTGLIYTITKFNVSHILDFLKYVYKIGIRSVLLVPVSPEVNGTTELVPNDEDLIANIINAIEFAIDLNIKNPNDRLNIDNIEAFALNIISDKRPSLCRMSPCGAGRFLWVISANGNVYPCSGFVGRKKWAMGNIFDDCLDDIQNSEVILKLSSRTAQKIESCIDCFYHHICGANCPIPLIDIHDDYVYKSNYCKFHQNLIDYFLLLLFENRNRLFSFLSPDEHSNIQRNSFEYDLKT